MIRVLFVSIAIYFSMAVHLEAGQIQFITSFEQAKKLAEKEQKIIFVDVMADWCGPCKKMMADIESRNDMVDFFNTNFINLKINEKFNQQFLNLYNVSAFPTVMFLTKGGDVIEFVRGYQGAKHLFGMARDIQEKVHLYTDNIHLNEGTFNETGFVEEISSKIVQMSPDLRKSYLKQWIKKGDPYQRAILEHFPSLVDYELFTEKYKKSGYRGDPAMTEKLMVSFLFHNGNYFSQDVLRKECKKLSKMTNITQNKLAAFLMAYREFVLFRQLGIAAGENMLVYARSLLSVYPETTDVDLLHDAFVELIKAEKSPEFYASIEPVFVKLSESSNEFIYNDILSVIYAKTGNKDAAEATVAAGMEKAGRAGKSFSPFLNRFRSEIFSE
jgi:thiol-disulfide isomerase/thioredoxin